MKKITQEQIKKKLKEVVDPEINISIVDLGLVYKIDINQSKNKKNDSCQVKIIMTLTTIGCPLFSLIEEEIKNKISQLGISKENITVELTFDPPWSIERISDRARAILGF